MKSVMKWFGIIVLVMAIGFSMSACDSGDSDKSNGNGNGNSSGNNGGSGSGIKPTITIKNSTGYSIEGGFSGGVYIKPSTEVYSWGRGLLNGLPSLQDGESLNTTLSQPLSVNNKYDIRLRSSSYNFVKYGVTVSNKMTITFTINDLNDMSSLPKITIQNRSGKSFGSVYIKPTFSTDWGEGFSGIGNNYDVDRTILIPPTNFTDFDIEARSSNPTNTYTKTNVTITNGMTILFTPLDKVNPTIENPVIVIQNNTGYNITRIRTNQPGSATLKDLTNSSFTGLADGNSQAFSIPPDLGNPIDIKLYRGSSNSSPYFIKSNVTVSDGLFLTFTASDQPLP